MFHGKTEWKNNSVISIPSLCNVNYKVNIMFAKYEDHHLIMNHAKPMF